MQYIQTKKQKQVVAQVQVRSVESAEQNPKQIAQWINNVNELHKTRPPPTVQYTKNMPDIETLMQEWAPEMEEVFNQVALPGPEIDLPLAEYAKMICGILDIPVQKLGNKKSLVEALHLLFSLYAEFKENPHFRHQKPGGEPATIPKSNEEVNYMKIS
jgi:intraflagellar transport protein 46